MFLISTIVIISAILNPVKIESEDEMAYDMIYGKNLASLATDYEGTPFNTLVGFVIAKDGSPIVFLSDMAVHTKNLKKKAEASIMVSSEDKEDPFNSSRLTFVGKIRKLEGDEAKVAKELFLKKYDEDIEWFIELEDFNYYKLEYSKIFWVGGFGDIRWFELPMYKKGLRNEKKKIKIKVKDKVA